MGMPQGSGGLTMEFPSPSRTNRGRQRKATGQKNINSKQNEQSVINILHWNAEGVSNRKEELQEFLHENNVKISCILTMVKELYLMVTLTSRYSASSIYCLVSLAFMLFRTSVITPPFFLSFRITPENLVSSDFKRFTILQGKAL
jgi:hypothetical protein